MDNVDHAAIALQTLLAPERAADQPQVYAHGRVTLSAAIATLALGGAERIVLDWATRCTARYDVRLVVLRSARAEWPVPANITITRLDGGDCISRLEAIGAEIAAGGNPVVLCHLLNAQERGALARGGAQPIPVLHNAAEGWGEDPGAFADVSKLLVVSYAARRQLRKAGVRVPCEIVHHI